MFTIPTVVTSNDMNKRSYITFYYNDERVREYSGKKLGIKLNPNNASSVKQRDELLDQLKYEFRKALEAGYDPTAQVLPEAVNQIIESTHEALTNTKVLLNEALSNKLKTDLSRSYKRDLTCVHDQFIAFATTNELEQPITSISSVRVEAFLSRFGSSGTYYMNKRRNLGVIFAAAGRLIDKPLKSVKLTPRRKSKSKLHEKYEKSQLRPILDYLKANYPNLYLCCLLTYSSWLRPHEEVRLLTPHDFKKELSEVHLTGGENKGGRVRVVHIPDYVRAELISKLSTLGRSDNIFTGHLEPYNYSYFNTQWSRAWDKMHELGLIYENQTIYSFRHTAAVDLYRRTKDVYLLQKLLGHSSIVVTLKYLRNLGELNSEDMKDAAPQL